MSQRRTEQDYADHLAKHPARRGIQPVGRPTEEIEPKVGRRYSFVVYGKSEPGGSKQAFVPLDKKRMCHCGPIPGKIPFRRKGGGIVVSVVDANRNAEKWKRHVAKTAREEYTGPLLVGALSVTFVFYRPRPKGHYGVKGLSKAGRDAPFLTTMPDVLKLARIAEDGITQARNVWVDDSLIVKETLEKYYGEPARVEITIEELKVAEPPAEQQEELFSQEPPWRTKEAEL